MIWPLLTFPSWLPIKIIFVLPIGYLFLLSCLVTQISERDRALDISSPAYNIASVWKVHWTLHFGLALFCYCKYQCNSARSNSVRGVILGVVRGVLREVVRGVIRGYPTQGAFFTIALLALVRGLYLAISYLLYIFLFLDKKPRNLKRISHLMLFICREINSNRPLSMKLLFHGSTC